MPAARKRNYRREYDTYHAKPEQRKRRSSRNKANRKMGTYGNGDGKDIAHKDNNPNNNSKKNLSKQSQRRNRSHGRGGPKRS